MTQAAGVWARIVAGMHGEVPADTLDVYRLAGSAVYDLLDRVHRQREEAKVDGGGPWAASRALQFQIAFAWNAFVLQALGDEFTGGEHAAPGFLPRVTAEQAAAFYHQVEPWVSRANQAASNPDYESDVHLPAELPPWVEVEPCPRAHLSAMMAALRSIRGRAVLAIGAFEEGEVPDEHRRRFGLVRQRIAAGDSSRVRGPALDRRPVAAAARADRAAGRGRARGPLRRGTDAGAAGAGAGDRPAGLGHVGAAGHADAAGPGSPGFDPWCLTDPQTRDRVRGDESARRAIDELWRRDPNPVATLDFQSRIDAALAAGLIARTRQHYHRCPWAPIYVVLRPLQLSTMRLRQLQHFTYDVSAEDMEAGGAFRRRLLVSTFSPVHEVDDRRPEQRAPSGGSSGTPEEPWRPKPGEPWRPPPFDGRHE